jgi:hypothetical protein
MADVVVTQEDRQAVAAFFRDGRTSIAVKFRLGAEPEPLLEAFARHRAQARKQALEEAAKVAGIYAGDHGLRPAPGWTDEQKDWWETGRTDGAMAIAAAIRAIKEEPK